MRLPPTPAAQPLPLCATLCCCCCHKVLLLLPSGFVCLCLRLIALIKCSALGVAGEMRKGACCAHIVVGMTSIPPPLPSLSLSLSSLHTFTCWQDNDSIWLSCNLFACYLLPPPAPAQPLQSTLTSVVQSYSNSYEIFLLFLHILFCF